MSQQSMSGHGFFLKKVVVVLQRIGRFNNTWAGVSSSLDRVKGHVDVASPHFFYPQRGKLLNCRLFIYRVCLVHQGFIGNGVIISTGIFSPDRFLFASYRTL